MSIVAWRVGRCSIEPERKEFARETAQCFFTDKGRRVAKVNSWERYFTDESAARNAIAAQKRRNDAAEMASSIRAAAPEMLETLEWLDSIGGLGASVHDRISAVIRKAKGGR